MSMCVDEARHEYAVAEAPHRDSRSPSNDGFSRAYREDSSTSIHVHGTIREDGIAGVHGKHMIRVEDEMIRSHSCATHPNFSHERTLPPGMREGLRMKIWL